METVRDWDFTGLEEVDEVPGVGGEGEADFPPIGGRFCCRRRH